MGDTGLRMKSCDLCKARKVRCRGAGHRGATACISCARRNVPCHFSLRRKPQRKPMPSTPLPSSAREDTPERSSAAVQYDGLQELYLDRLLACPSARSPREALSESLQPPGAFGGEYSLTFFSEARLSSLEQRLGHDRVSRLKSQLSAVISQRMRTFEGVPAAAADSDRLRVFGLDESFVASCVQQYFRNVHPLHPFLDRRQLESIALSPELGCKLASDKAWSALFYAVLALGSQYCDGGSFQPAHNVAWRLFSTALALFPDLLITRASLTVVQAMTVMAIFASNVSCMQFEYALICEGVRKSQILGYNRSPAPGEDARNRTFWVLFCLEKTMALTIGKSSCIMDSDICSAIPKMRSSGGEQTEFDCFLAWIRLSRLSSRIYASLHSSSVRGRSLHYFKAAIDRLKDELEQWRNAIPAPYQPTLPIRTHVIQPAHIMSVRIRLSYGYYNIMLHLDRAALQIRESEIRVGEVVCSIMRTTRSILELTNFIDVQPYTSLWVLAVVPLTAFFVLFDLVVDDPMHADTSSNLALLDIGAGHFSRIEYASEGVLPGSIAADFAHIARSYVRERSPFNADSSSTNLETSTTASGRRGSDPPGQFLAPSHPRHQPELPAWDLYDGATQVTGTDILDLFGSYLPGWDEEWLFSPVASRAM